MGSQNSIGRVIKPLALIACVLIVAAVGLHACPSRSRADLSFPTEMARKGTIEDSSVAIGVVKPQVGAEVKVGSRLSGVVRQLFVSVGDKLQKGDLLAILDDSEWTARIKVIQAQIDSLRAQQTFAMAMRDRAFRSVDLSQAERERSTKDLAVLEAQLRELQARLEETQVSLSYTKILAPIAGTVALISTHEGETVAASFAAPTFVTIINLDRLQVHAFVDETDIGAVVIGQPVTLESDTYPGVILDGRVAAIYPKAELVNNIVNYVVIISIDDYRGLLIRPEMTAHVHFISKRREQVVAIPRRALVENQGKYSVLARVNGGWREQAVMLGMQTSERVEVVNGLKEGQVYVADKQYWQQALGARTQ